MIIVKYDVNSCGVKLEAMNTGGSFILRDREASFECDDMKDLMARGGLSKIDEVWIPETPVTMELFDRIRALLLQEEHARENYDE